MENAKFHVSTSGRNRVLAQGVRNVHAWIEGIFLGADSDQPASLETGYYNPYKTETFINELTKEPIAKADLVHVARGRAFYRLQNEYVRRAISSVEMSLSCTPQAAPIAVEFVSCKKGAK